MGWGGVEIWSNIGFFEFALQIPGLHFLRSRATGCKIFSAFMKKKESFNFRGPEKMHDNLNVVRRVVSVVGRTERMTQEQSNALSHGESFYLCVAVQPSREWAKSKAFICIRRMGNVFDAKNQLLEKCLMRGTNEPLFFPFSFTCSGQSWLPVFFLLLFLYIAGTCHNFPLELSLHAPCEE